MEYKIYKIENIEKIDKYKIDPITKKEVKNIFDCKKIKGAYRTRKTKVNGYTISNNNGASGAFADNYKDTVDIMNDLNSNKSDYNGLF